MKLESILPRYELPLIGVIGATVPLHGYNSLNCRMLGYKLRELVNGGGTLFTGGVEGVGLDFYEGVSDYCEEHKTDDKFFVLFPEFNFEVNKSYHDLAKKTKNKILAIEKIGKDFEERRSYLAMLVDKLIVVNGSDGTMDEALKSLYFNKEVYSMAGSGGAADILKEIKEGKREKLPFLENLDNLYLSKSNEELIRMLGERK